MLKLLIPAIIIVIALLFVATPKISFRPFSVSFVNGWFALGIALIGIGIGLIRYQGYKEGVANGVKGTFTYIKEIIKKEKI